MILTLENINKIKFPSQNLLLVWIVLCGNIKIAFCQKNNARTMSYHTLYLMTLMKQLRRSYSELNGFMRTKF